MTAETETFTWKEPQGPFGFLDEDRVRAYSAEGGFILPGAFDAEEVLRVVDAVDPLEADAEAVLRAADGGRSGIARADEIIFAPHLVARSPCLRAFSRHPVFCGLTRDLIGPDVRLYWDQLVYKKPYTPDEFPWHQDNGYTFVLPQQYLTCWVALTDATVENGCPWIVPGAHRQGTLDHRWTDLGFECPVDADAAVPLELTAGSVAVFSSLTPHRTGPNRTGETRKAYILQYAPAGAVMYPRSGDPVGADNSEWQFPVVINGDRVVEAAA